MNHILAVVVIGRNEGERLSHCLRSIREMKHSFTATEVIYVDSASIDDSVRRARDSGARVISLPSGPTTAARGRNAGWRSTSADLVLFLDGDTVLDPDFVMNAMAALTEPKVAVVWGHRRELAPGASFYNRVLDLDWIYRPGVSDFCGGDALMRREVLTEVGGYNESLIAGEEPEMCGRMRACGYQIMHIDCPMTLHDLAMTSWQQYWKRATRAGFAYASISKRSRNTTQPLWVRDARRNLIHGSALLCLPILGISASLAMHSLIPITCVALLLLLLVMRTMRRVSWKCPHNSLTAFLYAIHSHLQQIPILFGQIKFFWDRGAVQQLIEYKESVR
jgi:cellulose synthase/poly-beta-1,6-N-acetylglucosamine synthase-like glycosyltransferase